MNDDYLIFGPDDIDLSRSPLRGSFDAETYVLGAFNPGFTRLPSGNLLMMVRVAEALREPVMAGFVRSIRWTPGGYKLDRFMLDEVDMRDPRSFVLKDCRPPVAGLTSLSWLLPVELTRDARAVVAAHYDKAIAPTASYMACGIEDARISRIDGSWFMTVCAASDERHCTVLYRSENGIDYRPDGIVLDHQNKDMCLFEGKVGGNYMALTRPLGEIYFAPPPGSPYFGGTAIQFAQSPDALHWRPLDRPGIRGRRGTRIDARIGGGTPPVLTEKGWLTIFHGVERRGAVGVYRSYWALLDREEPATVLRLEDETPLIEANEALTAGMADRLYLPTPVVFTTGIADGGESWIVASGEADLACRITHLPKAQFD